MLGGMDIDFVGNSYLGPRLVQWLGCPDASP
jgi:hypothetical protein